MTVSLDNMKRRLGGLNADLIGARTELLAFFKGGQADQTEFLKTLDSMNVSLDNMRRSMRGLSADVATTSAALQAGLGDEAFARISKAINDATKGVGFEQRITFAEEQEILKGINDAQLEQLVIQTIEARNARIDRRLMIRIQEKALKDTIMANQNLSSFLTGSEATFISQKTGREFTGQKAFNKIIKEINKATLGKGFERRISFAEEQAILAGITDKQLAQLVIQTIEARNAKIDRRLAIRAQQRTLHNAIVNNATLKHNLPLMRDKLQRLINLQNQMLEALHLINNNLSRIDGDGQLGGGRNGRRGGRQGSGFEFASPGQIAPVIPINPVALPPVTIEINAVDAESVQDLMLKNGGASKLAKAVTNSLQTQVG